MTWLILLAVAIHATAVWARMAKTNSKTAISGEDEVPALPPTEEPKGISIDWADPDAIMEMAQRVKRAGYPETAKALATAAEDTKEVKTFVDKAITVPLPSPIENVTNKDWSAFVALFRGGSVNAVSPTNCLGLFSIGFVRLRELGLADDVKQESRDGRPVWVGKLKTPMTVPMFLEKPALQYKVFAKDMRDRAMHIRTNYASILGTELSDLPGMKVSLSGLLGVIKLAGTKGFAGWVGDAKQRAKFVNTTAAFKTANGLF